MEASRLGVGDWDGIVQLEFVCPQAVLLQYGLERPCTDPYARWSGGLLICEFHATDVDGGTGEIPFGKSALS